MQIANPIYDVVFKYLMEDSKIAKLLISSIIQQDVELLDFRPQEFTSDIPKNTVRKKRRKRKDEKVFFTVYRLDFSAKIKTPDGEKIVIIEIQKAKFATDIMRFRKYLGEQYVNSENIYTIDVNGKKIKKACEIISIYFLGHKLENIHDVPVIKSEKKYTDVSSGKEIKQKEYFIDSLNHESYIIPIPELKEKRRNELELLLSVFDQSNRTSDLHILNVKEEDFPEKYREFIRRLQKAATEPDVRKKMDLEDEIIEELEDRDREIALKDAVIEEKDKVIEGKDKVIEETIKEKEDAVKEKEDAVKAVKEIEAAMKEKEKELDTFRQLLKDFEDKEKNKD